MTDTQRGTTALVTGASSGIGRELARIHAERGGDLVIVARSEGALHALKDELERERGVAVTVVVKDLARPEAPAELHEEVAGAGRTIDYLVNNAGFGGRGRFVERDWERDLAMIRVNVVALTALTRFFLPGFVERDRGRILNVSSTASLVPGPLQAVYYATKAYVRSFSNALAEELHDSAVTVTNLMPGVTDTGFASASGMDRTALFDGAAGARTVAETGYEAMLAGRLDAFAGVPAGQRLLMRAAPLLPKRMLMRRIRRMQEVDG